jgi:SAM-dependent methyltransferase
MRSDQSTTPSEAAFYHRRWLTAYDMVVLGLVSRWLWRCPSRVMLDHYDRHAGARHLDIGPGTGWFLDHCRFPAADPAITLLDANPAVLATAARRLRRYRPVTRSADALGPLGLETARFDSVGLNFLLHCLPGPMARKSIVLDRVMPSLMPGARVFGSTVLGTRGPHTHRSAALVRRLNRSGVFSNLDDDVPGLTRELGARFADVEVRTVGAVCLFAARIPVSR